MSIQKNIVWKGVDGKNSLENCVFQMGNDGACVNSVITGNEEGKNYKVNYELWTNKVWETIYLKVIIEIGDKIISWVFDGDGKGNWKCNGNEEKELHGCIDVDISATPFTNTLPVNRLKLTQDQSHEIEVLYIDIFQQKYKKLNQKYTRLNHNQYKYENVPNDFEAVIEIDDLGLVVNYPTLYQRIAIADSDHS